MTENGPWFPKSLPNYVFINQINTEPFKNFWKGVHNTTKKEVLIRVIFKDKLKDSKNFLNFVNEISCLKKAKHELFSNIQDVIEEKSEYYIVFDFPKPLSLRNYVTNYGAFSEEKAKSLINSFLLIADHLITLNIFDVFFLNPDTIFLNQTGDIIQIFPSAIQTVIFENASSVFNYFIAPEETKNQSMPTDTSTLVWRLGVMLYYLFTGNFPFRSKSIEKLKTKILSKTVEIPSKLSGPIQTILVKMFTKNPSMRIQLCEIQSFFSQIPINEDKKKAPIVRARTNIALTSSKTISRSSMNLRPVSITPRRQLQSTLDQGTLLNLERPQDIEDEGQKRKSRALFASRPNISMKRPRSSLKLK